MAQKQVNSNSITGKSPREILQTLQLLQKEEGPEKLSDIDSEEAKIVYRRCNILTTVRKNIMRGNLSVSELCDKLEINYRTTNQTIDRLRDDYDLIKTKKIGKEKKIKLTDKGSQVAQKFTEIQELVRQ